MKFDAFEIILIREALIKMRDHAHTSDMRNACAALVTRIEAAYPHLVETPDET